MLAAMNESAIRLVIRITARTSLLLFVAAFTGTGLKALWPGGWSEWFASRRVAFLRGLAASHLSHFAAVVTLDVQARRCGTSPGPDWPAAR